MKEKSTIKHAIKNFFRTALPIAWVQTLLSSAKETSWLSFAVEREVFTQATLPIIQLSSEFFKLEKRHFKPLFLSNIVIVALASLCCKAAASDFS